MKKVKEYTRKRRILPVLLALGVFALIGGTIAVSQDRSILDDIFHLKYGSTESTETFDSPQDWKRCDESPKTVVTTNNSTFPIRVRLSYDEYWLAADDATYLPVAPGGNRLTTINLQNQNDWEDGNDGWMYWKGTLAPGDSTRSLLKSVTYNCDSGTAVETICRDTPTGHVCEQPVDPYEDASYHVFVTVQTTEENGQFPADTLYNVSVNPNGGEYNGNSSVFTDRVRRGTVLDLTNISYTDHELRDWTLNSTSTYTGQTIVINEDTDLVANWLSSTFYDITVDPNGGSYDGSTSPSTYSVRDGTVYNLLTPTKEGYLNDHWELVSGSGLSGNTISVSENTTVRATWGKAIARIERTGELFTSIMNAEAVAETNDVITLLDDTTETVTNTKTVTLDLDSHTVTGSITNTGNLTLINGEINNPSGAAVTNNGALTIGINDYKQDGSANILNDNIRLIGTTVGLQQNSVFNFYDGYIEGDVALAGGYDSAPFYHNVEHDTYIYYYPFISHNDVKDCQHAELASADNSVSKTTVGGDIYYLNLQDNINTSAVTGYKIYAVRNFQASYPVTVASGDEIEFDVAGYEVTFADTMTNNGHFTITNSGNTGKALASQTIINNGEFLAKDIEIAGTTSNDTITNNDTLKLRNATLSAMSGYVIQPISNTTLDMDNDSYITTTSTSHAAIYNNATDLTINAGHIVAPYIGIYNGSNKNITMTGGNITVTAGGGSSYGIYCDGGGLISLENNSSLTLTSSETPRGFYSCNTVTLKDSATATISSSTNNAYGAYNSNVVLDGNSILSVSGDMGTTGVYNAGPTTTFPANSNAQLTVNSRHSATGVRGNLTMNSGTISVTSASTGSEAVGAYYSSSYGSSTTTTINGGSINATNTGSGNATALKADGDYAGTLYLNGGTHTAQSNTGSSYGVYEFNYNGNRGTTVINDGSLTATSTSGTAYGFYVNGGATNEVKSGTISGGNYGIYSTGYTVKLGEDTGTAPSTTSPEIYGGVYGLYGGGYNFYDGRLKGGTNSYQAGVISAIPDATVINTETIDGIENSWLVDADNYLEVNGVQYNSLTKAYNAITGNSGTITVIDDARIEATLPASPADKTITFDLNGHTLTYTNSLVNSGTMTIVDSSQAGTGILRNPNTYVITNNGTLNIQSSQIDAGSQAIRNGSSATINMTGGKITAPYVGISSSSGTINLSNAAEIDLRVNSGSAYGIYCDQWCDINMSDTSKISVQPSTTASNIDTLRGTYRDGYISGKGTTTLEDDASIIVKSSNRGIGIADGAIVLNDNALIDVEAYSYTAGIQVGKNQALTIPANTNAIINVQGHGGSMEGAINGDIDMSSGTINVTAVSSNQYVYGINYTHTYQDANTATIRGGAINVTNSGSGTTAGLYAHNDGGYAVVTGGTITVNNTSDAFGILARDPDGGASITMSGGTITATSSNATGYGINTSVWTNTITGGKVEGSNYGVYANGRAVTFGDNEEPVSIVSPEIVGGEYGVYSGSFSLFDGILKGGTNAHETGSITSIPDAYVFHDEVVGSEEHCWLVAAANYLEVDGTQFNSLSKAYDAITSDSGTIKVIASTRVEAALPDSPSGKTITFDLNGYQLVYTNSLVNSSTMNIVDSSASQTGTLTNPSTYAITNNGTLNIQSGTIVSTDQAVKNNSGTINMSGGSIESVYIGINNSRYSEVNLTGGTISVKRDDGGTIYGIYCFRTCEINMSNNSSIDVGRKTSGGSTDRVFGIDFEEGGSDENYVTMEDNSSITVNGNHAYGINWYGSATLRDNASITVTGENGATGISSMYTTIEQNSTVSISATAYAWPDAIGIGAGATIYSGTITALAHGSNAAWAIRNGEATANIYGGTLTATNDSTGPAYGTGGNWGSHTNIYGGDITASTISGESAGVKGEYDEGRNSIYMSGGTVTATSTSGVSYGFRPYDSSNNVIVGGTLTAGTYGIYGSATIGDNDGTVSTTSPVITAGDYALYSGTYNFYDGIIKGGTYVYDHIDAIMDVATNHTIKHDTEQIGGQTYQTSYLVPETDVAQIGSTKYTKLSDAVTAANTGDTIDLIADNNMFYALSIPSGKDITIDTHGYNIVTGRPITNNGKLKLTNSNTSQNPTITYRYSGDYFMTNNDELEIDGINISSPYVINNNGTLALKDTTLTATGTAISSNDTITLSNATINAQATGISNSGSISNTAADTTTTITGGDYAIYTSTGNIDLHNVTLTGSTSYYQNDTATSSFDNCTMNGAFTSQRGTVDIANSTLSRLTEDSYDMVYNGGTMTIQNSTINYGVTNGLVNSDRSSSIVANASTMTLNTVDVNISLSGYLNSNTYGIDNYDNAQLEMTDADITYTTTNVTYDGYTGYGLWNGSGTTNFHSGSISVDRIRGYGIYNTSGEVTLGDEEDPSSAHYGDPDANVSVTDPSVTVSGTTWSYGVKNESGRVNMFDGVIRAKTHPMPDMPDIPTKTEYHFEARVETDGDYQKLTLKYIQS